VINKEKTINIIKYVVIVNAYKLLL
jgi:hypothetical protein